MRVVDIAEQSSAEDLVELDQVERASAGCPGKDEAGRLGERAVFGFSPLEAARYVDEFNSPAVGWHFDVGNVITFGWPEQWIRILGKRIQKLHIKEYSRKKRDNEGLWKGFQVPFLEGDNDWPAIMKALDDIGYNGWGIAEQGGGDTIEGLKDLSARMTKIFAS